MLGSPLPLEKTRQPIAERFYEMVQAGNLAVTFKHVKGHTKGGEPRLDCNIYCDRRARRAMRKARQEYKHRKITEYLYEN